MDSHSIVHQTLPRGSFSCCFCDTTGRCGEVQNRMHSRESTERWENKRRRVTVGNYINSSETVHCWLTYVTQQQSLSGHGSSTLLEMHWILNQHSVFHEACWNIFLFSLTSFCEHGSISYSLQQAQLRDRPKLGIVLPRQSNGGTSTQASTPLFSMKVRPREPWGPTVEHVAAVLERAAHLLWTPRKYHWIYKFDHFFVGPYST